MTGYEPGNIRTPHTSPAGSSRRYPALEAWEGMGPAHTLTLDLWPRAWWGCLLPLWLPRCVGLCYSGHGRLTQVPTMLRLTPQSSRGPQARLPAATPHTHCVQAVPGCRQLPFLTGHLLLAPSSPR